MDGDLVEAVGFLKSFGSDIETLTVMYTSEPFVYGLDNTIFIF